MAVSVMWLFLAVACVGVQCVIVLFPDYTYFCYMTGENPDS